MNRKPVWILSSLTAAVVLAVSWPAHGQATSRPSSREGYEITATPDHADGLYKSGEEIAFTITVTRNGKPVTEGNLVCQMTINDTDTQKSNWLDARLGQKLGEKGGTVLVSLKQPSCVVLRAEYRLEGNRSVWIESGAAADADKIGLSTPAPDDFDAFWAAQKKRLAAVPMNAKLTPVEGNNVPATTEAFDVQADCVGGAPMSAYYGRPKGAKPKSLPARLTVHGAGVRSSVLAGVLGAGPTNSLVMDLNAHGIPNGRPAEFYSDLLKGDLLNYARRGIDSRDTYYFLGMYLRLQRAMDFLCSQPEWDGKNLIVSGSSQGGAQAVVAAGLDERVSILSASLPALCDLTGMQVNRSAGWPFQRAALDANQVKTVRYYDVCHFAARTKATAVVRVGLIDHTCPPAGVLAMFNQLKGPKYLFTHPDSGHSYSPPGAYVPANDKLRELIAEAIKK